MAQERSCLLLRKQLAELHKCGSEGFSAGLIDDDDVYKWEVVIYGPPDTLFKFNSGVFSEYTNNGGTKVGMLIDSLRPFNEGGCFKAHLNFPKEYPNRPPKMKFVSEMWHPNIDPEGNVCISILHEPGDDKYGYEKASERWLPIHTVETILVSVISMLADPNDESPANVDAAKMWREQPEEFKKRVSRCVRKSQDEFL